jgi:tol-pal system protein YbgF
MTSTLRLPRRLAVALLVAIALSPVVATPAFAVNKDMVQLQTQIQDLQNAVAKLQESNDERMGVLKDLVQQNADSVNKMSVALDTLEHQLQGQQNAEGTKVDQVSNQVQSLNDSLDELKARMGRMEKLLQDIQSQQQSMGATMQGGGAPGSAAPGAMPTDIAPQLTAPPPASAPGKKGKPSAAIPLAPAVAPAPIAAAAPPADDLYKAALGDYMSAKYALAFSEFGDVTRSYPDNALSGNAFYYLGEIDYRQGHYAAAVHDYDKVIEQFPDSNKVPACHLHKGQALILEKQNDAGVREFRSLIERFPNSPEALQARSRLNGMGVPIKPRQG